MAFADSLRGNEADVRLVADTGQFNAQIEKAEQQWRESIASMSREALKLDLAQDRLNKSLAKTGAESAQTKRATIALKDAEEQAARATDRHARAARSSSSSMQSLRRNIVGLAAAYIGVHGLVSGIRSSVEAAREEQLVLGQTKIAVEAAGLSWAAYETQIQEVIRAQSQLGFDDEALLKTFQMFVRSTRDVSKALELNALAADVARGRYIDLEQAAQIVNKANLGMSGALRRIGIDVDKNATRVELLTALTENYGQAAEEASTTSVAAAERFGVEWENTKEIIGRGLLPVLTDLSNRLADYFGDAQNQAEVQRRVNEAVETGEEVVRGIAGAFRIANAAIRPFVNLVGGAENAVKLLLLAMAVGKVLSFASAIRLIGTNAIFARRQMALLATTPVPGRGIPIPVLGVNPAVAVGAAVLAAGGGGTQRGDRSAEYPLVYDAVMRASAGRATPQELAILRAELGSYSLANAPDDRMARAERRLRAAAQQSGAAASPDSRSGMTRGGGQGASVGSGDSGGGGSRGGASAGPTLEDLLLNVARPGNDRADLEALRAYYARQIRALEGKKNLTKAQKEALRALYGEIASVQSQIDALDEEQERKQEELNRKAAERDRKAQERLRREMERADRVAEERAKLLRGTGGNRANMRRQALRGVDGVVDALRKRQGEREKERALTEAEIRRMHVEFLTGLQGLTNQFGSNISPDQTATNTWTTAQLNREMLREIQKLTQSVQHPGAKYASSEMAVVLGGVGAI